MQSYPLNLSPASSGRVYGTTANLFVYESGESALDTRIIVKPDSGSEITVRPGQRFRLPPGEKAVQWSVRLYNPDASVVGSIIIGSGEFDDANTNNIVTLAEGFSNNVRVNNTNAERIPVALDPAAVQPVSLAGTKITNTNAERVPVAFDPGTPLSTSENLLAYTTAKKVTTGSAGYGTICTPAENVNGIIIEQLLCEQAASATRLNFKAGAQPSGIGDEGELIAISFPSGLYSKRTKVAAGKGAYLYHTQGTTTHALLTVL